MSTRERFIFSPGIRRLAQGIVLCVVAFLAYSNSFHTSFHFDDFPFVVENPRIHDITNLKAMLEMFSEPTRVLTLLSFAANYALHGTDVFWYHVTNFIIHLLAGLCVWWLAALVARTVGQNASVATTGLPAVDINGRAAYFVALLFVAHPVQTQAVTYISQRYSSFTTLWYVLSVCLFLAARLVARTPFARIGYFVGSAVACLAAMLSKEEAITLPILIAVCEYCFVRPFVAEAPALVLRDKKKKKAAAPQAAYAQRAVRRAVRFSRWDIILVAVLIAAICIIPAIFSFEIRGMLMARYHSESHDGDIFGAGEYVLTQPRVFAQFVRLLVVPVGLNLDYDFPISRGLLDPPGTLVSLLFMVGMLIVAVRAYRRYPAISFGLCWMLITFGANFVPRVNVIFEHKVYLLSVGFFCALVFGLFSVVKDRRVATGILVALTCVYAVLTFQRNRVWKDERTLWSDVLRKSPNKARAHINMGTVYLNEKDYHAALMHFDQALARNQRLYRGYRNRGMAHAGLKKYEAALADLSQAIVLERSDYTTYYNRADVYARMGDEDAALADCITVLEIHNGFSPGFASRGALYRKRGLPSMAMADLNRAILLDGKNHLAYNERGFVYALQGEYARALADFNTALHHAPDFSPAYVNRGKIYIKQGAYADALADFNEAIRHDPDSAMAYYNRGDLYLLQNKDAEAVRDIEKALALDPRYAEAYGNRGILCGKRGDYACALESFNTSIEIDPRYFEGYSNRGFLRTLQKEYAIAVEDFSAALAIRPESADVYNKRGSAYYMLKEYQKAYDDFSKAVEIDPAMTDAVINRAAAQKILGIESRE